jgi:hypothetical protein
MSAIYPLSVHRRIERQWPERINSLRQIRGQIVIGTKRTLQRVFNNDDSLITVPASNSSSGFAKHFFHWSGSRRRRILSDGQSLVRRTLPRSLAISTELANRAVSSICLAGLCDWSLACISFGFGFDPLSSSSTVGFRDILVSPWPFTVPTSIQRIGCGTCARFWTKIMQR